MSIATITPKDVKDLAFGQKLGVDYVALSFVRSAADLERARKHVKARNTPLIAKIEKPQAVDNIDAVIAGLGRADGRPRRPRGRAAARAACPASRRSSVRRTNKRGKLVIVATEMLESMILNARPTRAEVSDVANAIYDGADAVMLSGETASGKHPVEAVRDDVRRS